MKNVGLQVPRRATQRASASIVRTGLRSLGRSFYGSIAENCERFQFIGQGYAAMPAEQGGHFRLYSARHLSGPLTALLDDAVRIVHLIGATQVLKSVAGDAWVIYAMEHIRRNLLVLFEDEGKADLYCKVRLMDTLKQHPHIIKILAETTKESRHRVTGTWIKTLVNEMLVAGLNDGNVSSLTWPMIWISEAWQHKSDGLLFKAFKRADRFPEDSKILNESQAGLAGENLHQAVKVAHPVSVEWTCPACGGPQTWEWKHWSFKRTDDFKPRELRTISTITIGGEAATVSEQPKPGSYGGMKWLNSANDENKYSIEERARTAYWDCIWCGHHIEDTPAQRQSLMDGYQQEYRTNREGFMESPKQAAFYLPFECARDNRFESTVKSFLLAKDAEAAGDNVRLQHWFMAERAFFYSDKMTRATVAVITGTYDPTVKQIENECFRSLQVDCQKDMIESLKQGKEVTGHFWYVLDAVDKSGNTFQLDRGYATSWDELFGPAGIRIKFGVPVRNVVVDGGHWLDTVKEKAAQYRTLENRRADGSTEPGKRFVATWKIFCGDDARGWRHKSDGVWRSYSEPKADYADVLQPDGTWLRVNLSVYRWSNFSVTNQLQMLRMGMPGKPRFLALDVSRLSSKTRAKEVGDFTYDSQMNGQILGEERNKRKWIDLHPQQHYADCSKMGIVLKAMKGLIGHQAAPDEAAQESK